MIHTKRYLAAAGSKHYPLENLRNIVGAFDTVEQAIQAARDSDHIADYSGCRLWIAVYDLLRQRVVAEGANDGFDGVWEITMSDSE